MAIYNYTAEQWSEQQADDYAAFLDATTEQLAINPTTAPLVPDEPNTHCYVARWNNTRQGHRIFFEEIENGIYVLRILHTAMNWPDIVR